MLALLLGLSAFAQDTGQFDDDQFQDSPIINGDAASVDDYPMTGAILFSDKNHPNWYGPMMWCSSTLIAPDVVLTAAHCVDEELMEYYFGHAVNPDFRWSRQADLFNWDGSLFDLPEDAVPSWDWARHQSYSIWDFEVGIAKNDDIALLFLDEIVTTPHAYLPSPEQDAELTEGMEVTIVGWGQQEQDSHLVGIKQVGHSSITELGSHEFQVGLFKTDDRKCHGDSGGPSFIQVDGSEIVVGVTSHAYDSSDCSMTGGVDTRVGPYLQWIDEQMRMRCADGTRLWCDEPGIIPQPIKPLFIVQNVYGQDSEESLSGTVTGCSSATAPSSSLLALFGLVALGRRRTRKN